MHALRTDQYKYIHYYGVWDIDELYDVQADPRETKNLITSPAHQPVVRQLNQRLFEKLEATGGMWIPLKPDRGGSANLRRTGGSRPADFPAHLMREKSGKQ
jgi:N-acetylglucosamine-6-sulfatase